jgi:Xaa-Pro aminopeptidase
MERNALDGLIVSTAADVRYVSNYSFIEGQARALVFVPAADEPTLFIDQDWDLVRARSESFIPDIRVSADFRKGIQDIFKSRADHKIGVVGWSTFPTPIYLSIKELKPDIEFQDSTEFLEVLRMIKSPAEIKCLEKAAKITEEGVKAAAKGVEKGKTEIEIGAAAEMAMKLAGASEFSFPTWIGSGERANLIAPYPSKKKPQKGELVMLDMGGRCNGYCGDVTRMKKYGTLAKAQRDLVEVMLQMRKECISALRPGIRASEVHEISKKVAREAGYDKFIGHTVGHGLGLGSHDKPWFEGDDTKLVPGIVHTIEPNLYVPGVGGGRIEDMILITDTGHKLLTSLDRNP